MSEHEIRYDSGQENSLSCHITWVHTQMTVASPALIHRSVLPKTIMLSFIPAFPWGMSIRVLPTRRKAFSRNHYHSSKNKDRRQNLGKNTDQWKFPKQFPPMGSIFLDTVLAIITTTIRKGQYGHLSGVSPQCSTFKIQSPLLYSPLNLFSASDLL